MSKRLKNVRNHRRKTQQKLVSVHSILEELREMVEESSLRIVNAETGLSYSRISEFLSGKRPLSRKAVKALGYDPTPFYKKDRS